MEPSALRTYFTLLLALLFSWSFANNTYNPTEIKDRLEAMECVIKPRYTSVVESYIRGYLARDKGKAARVLGRATVYFPIFEKYLEEHGLPQDLKYLAVVESALLPKATSPVGAGGLWQFMKETGRAYGLTINAEVDERSCPHNSTEAAMKYLAKQYERYGSWELALAAYNCGAGVINNAVKRSRSNDYWRLSRYLPKETQNFVPAFLAVAYLVTYYHEHEVVPAHQSLDMQLTEEIKVYTRLDFATIAALTGLPAAVVQEMNPAFKKDFVPENPNGHYVVVPKRTIQALRDYLDLLRPDNGAASPMPELPALTDSASYHPDDQYYQTLYTVAEGDNLMELGKIFNCSAYNLKAWNNLTSYHVNRGQELIIWFPKEFLRFRPANRKVSVVPPAQPVVKVVDEKEAPKPKIQPIEEVKTTPAAPSSSSAPAVKEQKPVAPKKEQTGRFTYHQLRRNESLLDVAALFPGITVKNLLEWNGFSMSHPPQVGAILRIQLPEAVGMSN